MGGLALVTRGMICNNCDSPPPPEHWTGGGFHQDKNLMPKIIVSKVHISKDINEDLMEGMIKVVKVNFKED